MSVISRLMVELGMSSTGLDAGLANSKKSLESWGNSFHDVGTKLTAGLTTPIIVGLGKSISLASDLNEATSATDTIFGESD